MSSNKLLYQTKEITQWEWPEVEEWLTENNFTDVISKLEPHAITGYDLFYLTPEQMKAFNIVGFNEINRLNRAIHSKVLEYLRISFAYENTIYSYQLDFEPNLTVESMANTIGLSLGIKDQLFISTQDNKVLFPYIKIIELLLIEPDKYRNLKVFNEKEATPTTMNKYAFNSNSNLSSNPLKQITPIATSNSTIPASSLPIGMNTTNANTMPQSNMPIMPSALSLKYKSNFEELGGDKQDIDGSNKLKEKKNEDGIPSSNANADVGINKPELSFKSKYDSELKPSAYMQFKMNQKQPQQQPVNNTMDDQKLSNNFYNKTLGSNQINSFSNTNPNLNMHQQQQQQKQQQDIMTTNNNNNPMIKDVKDSMDLNNPTTNYIFNSGELLTYDQIKKNQGKNTIPSSNLNSNPYVSIQQGNNINNAKEDMMGYNKDSYQKYKANPSLNLNANNNPLNSEMPQVNKDKDDYRRFSSEKRNFRTYGNLSNSPQEEEYQPKAYEKFDKFNNAPLEDFNDKFNNEKFNRFSSRQPQSLTQGIGQNQNQNQNLLPSYSSHQMNYDMKSKKLQNNSGSNSGGNSNNIRNNQFDNFNMERKPYHHQIPIQTTSDEYENSNNQTTQERVN